MFFHKEDNGNLPRYIFASDPNSVYSYKRENFGFKRVVLEPGEEKEVTIPFDDKTFRFYDTRTDTWEIESGEYQIMIGSDAHR